VRRLIAFFMLGVVTWQAAAGTIGADQRLAIANYASENGLDAASARKLFGASGRIMCPFNAANAFLIHRRDIVLTARRVVLLDPNRHAFSGVGRPSHCAFEVSADGVKSTWHEVDVETVIWLPIEQRSFTDRFDWIVMKLENPIPDVVPYALPNRLPEAGDDVTLVTLRQDDIPHDDWNERILEDCNIRDVVDIDGVPGSGLKTDCSAAPNASGGALVRKSWNGPEVVGVQSSSTRACRKYDERSCNSFAVGLHEDIRQAILSLADETPD
jgi:hypothetical protein